MHPRPTLALRLPRAVVCPSSRRLFRSRHDPSPRSPFGAAESAILAAAYQHIPEYGFSQQSLRLGARDAGLLDISPAIFTAGPFNLVRYHLITQRLALASHTAGSSQDSHQNEASRSVAARIAALAWARLIANRHVIHQWQHALAIMAQPSHVPASLKELAFLSDEILFLAGDKAVDASWYSKRASFSAIYSTSELFMTNDTSPDFSDTKAFLDRRLRQADYAGSIIGSLGQWTDFTAKAGINVLRSKGVRI